MQPLTHDGIADPVADHGIDKPHEIIGEGRNIKINRPPSFLSGLFREKAESVTTKTFFFFVLFIAFKMLADLPELLIAKRISFFSRAFQRAFQT